MRGGPWDVVVVGAGPNGLATAIHLQRRGLKTLVLERGMVAEHIAHFPSGMVFFLPRWTTDIASLPCDSRTNHPSREEAVSYFRRVARVAGLEIHTETAFQRLEGQDGAFMVHAERAGGEPIVYQTRKVVLAAGTYSQPRRLEAPGSELPKVRYGYGDPLDYSGRRVVIVGAGNGAAEAALRLHHEAGAAVTVLNRHEKLRPLKWRWSFGDLAKLTDSGAIRVVHGAAVEQIEPEHVTFQSPLGKERILNDVVLVIIGYRPDPSLFNAAGVRFDEDFMPEIDARTLATNVPGVYVAGVACGGSIPELILIAGGRRHGQAIAAHILGEPPPIEDLGRKNRAHWAQFERLTEEPDAALLRLMVPVVTGELRDDVIDVYQSKLERSGITSENFDRTVTLGAMIDELPPELALRREDGSGVFKGQELSALAFEILRLADGSRRVHEIAAQIAEATEEDPENIEPMITDLFVSLMHSGRLTWRAAVL